MDPRILFVDHTGALGGAELYLLDLARAYRERCTVLLFEDGPFRERLKEEGISVEVVSASGQLQKVRKESALQRAVRAVPELFSLARQVGQRARTHDLIFANSQKALVVTGLASGWSRRPLIWNLHDLLTRRHFSAVNRWMATRWANWFADRVVVNSEATRAAFSEQGGDCSKTGLVYNGIDARPFDTVTTSAVRAARHALDLNARTPVVGIFSRIAEWKGQDVMIRALPSLPNVHLLLVGEATFETDEEYEQTLRALCERLGVADRVHFLGFRRDVPRLMKAVDAVVHTSTAPEPFGRVIVEAMLARTPVVATRAGGPEEIIDDDETGLLVPSGDPSALSRAVGNLLHSADTTGLVRQARSEARSRFSLDTMLKAADKQISQTLNT